MTKINEIAPDVYRISIYISDFDLQFNHFLVNDDEPVLIHTGLNATFDDVRDSVSKIIEPSRAIERWVPY